MPTPSSLKPNTGSSNIGFTIAVISFAVNPSGILPSPKNTRVNLSGFPVCTFANKFIPASVNVVFLFTSLAATTVVSVSATSCSPYLTAIVPTCNKPTCGNIFIVFGFSISKSLRSAPILVYPLRTFASPLTYPLTASVRLCTPIFRLYE